MKKILTLALVLALAGGAAADNHFITFKQTDGTERSLPLEGLNITFADGQLSATGSNDSFVLDLSTMQSMFFASAPTGVELRNEMALPRVTFVYDLQGRRVNTADGEVKGIYIIKDGEGARKEIRR